MFELDEFFVDVELDGVHANAECLLLICELGLRAHQVFDLGRGLLVCVHDGTVVIQQLGALVLLVQWQLGPVEDSFDRAQVC